MENSKPKKIKSHNQTASQRADMCQSKSKPTNEKSSAETSKNDETRKEGLNNIFSEEGAKCENLVILIDSDEAQERGFSSENLGMKEEGLNSNIFSKKGTKRKLIISDSDEEEGLGNNENNLLDPDLTHDYIFSKEVAKRRFIISNSDDEDEEENGLVNNRNNLLYSDPRKKGAKRKLIISDSDDEDQKENGSVNNKTNLLDPDPTRDFGKWLFLNFQRSLKENNLLNENDNCVESIEKGEGTSVNLQSDGVGSKRVYVPPESSTSNCEGQAHNITPKKHGKEKEGITMNGQDLSTGSDLGAEREYSVESASMEYDVSNNPNATPDIDLEPLWRDRDLAMEIANENKEVQSKGSQESNVDEEDICVHKTVLKEELGLVCRICGLIEKPIESIFEFNWNKHSRRTYHSRYFGPTNPSINPNCTYKTRDQEINGTEIFLHPRHQRHIRSHQMEGFNFLVKNLTGENPGGCILAHAPGSGKTFVLISFIQSFLAKYPNLRPLIVLPKGIVPTWRKEFLNWQIEDIPLYDFYSSKADNISQKLKVLNLWEETKSVMLLGYQQFASIITDRSVDNPTVKLCQEKLLKVPGLLILDEGHTPRNDSTDILNSLSKIQTVRKVVLSGTLFQNHVKEVFSIVNLIRPRFLKSDHAKPIVRRIMSWVDLAGKRVSKIFSEAQFYELVEETLKKEEYSRVKAAIIQNLRDLTANILHYYKGDFLDELPGLCDYTVFLCLTPRQKKMVDKTCLTNKNSIFKRNATCALISVHPSLEQMKDETMDTILTSLNAKEGVKAQFVMNILSLAVSKGEKVLVFGMYLKSLELLQNLVLLTRGWVLNKEVFSITGESSQMHREWAMERFNVSKDAKILFGSVKACGEGISLVGGSRLVILDQHANPSVTRQVVGRAFRPGQARKVFVYRLVACGSPDEEEHATSFRKELISKLWFEWNQNESYKNDFELEQVDLENWEDMFFESSNLGENMKALYKR